MIQYISVRDLKELRKKETPHILIDVREQDEYEEGHIEGSILIPRGEIQDKIESVVTEKDTLIVLHCATDRRSGMSSEILESMGYTNVKVLQGGYQAWRLTE